MPKKSKNQSFVKKAKSQRKTVNANIDVSVSDQISIPTQSSDDVSTLAEIAIVNNEFTQQPPQNNSNSDGFERLVLPPTIFQKSQSDSDDSSYSDKSTSESGSTTENISEIKKEKKNRKKTSKIKQYGYYKKNTKKTNKNLNSEVLLNNDNDDHSSTQLTLENKDNELAAINLNLVTVDAISNKRLQKRKTDNVQQSNIQKDDKNLFVVPQTKGIYKKATNANKQSLVKSINYQNNYILERERPGTSGTNPLPVTNNDILQSTYIKDLGTKSKDIIGERTLSLTKKYINDGQIPCCSKNLSPVLLNKEQSNLQILNYSTISTDESSDEINTESLENVKEKKKKATPIKNRWGYYKKRDHTIEKKKINNEIQSNNIPVPSTTKRYHKLTPHTSSENVDEAKSRVDKKKSRNSISSQEFTIPNIRSLSIRDKESNTVSTQPIPETMDIENEPNDINVDENIEDVNFLLFNDVNIDNFLANLDVNNIIRHHAEDIIERYVNIPNMPQGPLYLHAANPYEEPEYTLGPLILSCNHCLALHFRCEQNTRRQYTKCCSNGDVQLPNLLQYPQVLINLFNNREFREKIRAYNNAFALASLGANIIQPDGHGPYCFKVQGEIRHNLGHIVTNIPNEQRLYGNLYFIDTENANQIRANGPQNRQELDIRLIEIISDYLLQHNPLIQAYRFLKDVYQEQINAGNENPTVHLTINNNRAHDINFRQYGAVQSNEIAGIFVGQDGLPPAERFIFVYCQNNIQPFHRISYLSENCDALLYPLIFPHGESGWRTNQPHFRTRGNISLLQYYAFRLAMRPNVYNPILMSGKLTQQFLVDSYIKVEQSRLDYHKTHQQAIRADCYQGLIDYLNNRQLEGNYLPGNLVILPSDFIGSPRNMRQRYLDAMAMVSKFGKPDIFLTITSNPSWSEVRDNLPRHLQPSDRPDLLSRVFKCKLDQLMTDIDKGHIFGVCLGYVYVIEFQKRGLPHAHILLWLQAPDKITDAHTIDRIIKAEFPSVDEDDELFELVKTHMVHGPCTVARCLNPNTNVCQKGFPKQTRADTIFNPNGYPYYQRLPLPQTIEVRGRQVDNKWVVPYNPYLLKKYKAHINVEACSSIKSVKYLFKYIYKGHDRVVVVMNQAEPQPRQNVEIENAEAPQEQPRLDYDEIQQFLDMRYISAPEAVWHLQKFNMQEISHAIIRLAIHLPNQQQVYFGERVPLEVVAQRAADRLTTLTAWFVLNQQNENARQFTYLQIPYHYVFQDRTKRWNQRQRNIQRIIPRLYYVHPREGERFFLRQILCHKRGATSFEDLRTVNNHLHVSFRDAAIAMNLTADDIIWQRTLREAVSFEMPRSLRRMFAQMLIFCEILNPLVLWEEFRNYLSEDYIRQFNEDVAYNYTLAFINRYLSTQGKSNADYQLPMPEGNIRPILDINPELDLNPPRELEIANRNIPHLNAQQRYIFDRIIGAVSENQEFAQRYFYLDGAAGCGKSYLLNTIISYFLGQNRKVIAMAYTGIAASLLRTGRTIHSTFMMPVPFLENSTSKIRNESQIAHNIRYTQIIICDEISMVPKTIFNAMDEKLRELMGNNLPFGGKVIVVSGDFKQIPPVVPLAGKFETISASVKASRQWQYFTRYELTTNIRALPEENEFKQFLTSIGNASNILRPMANDSETSVRIPNELIVDNIVESVYGNQPLMINDISLLQKAILCPWNAHVIEINEMVLNKLPGEFKQYFSADSVITDENANDDENLANAWPEEFLNSLTAASLPPHILRLKIGCVIILLKNLDVERGLCNGTRMIVRNLRENIIEASKLSANGNQFDDIEFIPRIDNIAVNTTELPVNLKRRQFPIRLSFAMTINKSQGQTLNQVGLYLPAPVFSHGQLYVAFSRVRSIHNLCIQMNDVPTRQFVSPNRNDDSYTVNIVYKELLRHNNPTAF